MAYIHLEAVHYGVALLCKAFFSLSVSRQPQLAGCAFSNAESAGCLEAIWYFRPAASGGFMVSVWVWLPQPAMPLSICALWELMPNWNLLLDGWCSHCKQLNFTAQPTGPFFLLTYVTNKLENRTDPNIQKMRLSCIFIELVCCTGNIT